RARAAYRRAPKRWGVVGPAGTPGSAARPAETQVEDPSRAQRGEPGLGRISGAGPADPVGPATTAQGVTQRGGGGGARGLDCGEWGRRVARGGGRGSEPPSVGRQPAGEGGRGSSWGTSSPWS